MGRRNEAGKNFRAGECMLMTESSAGYAGIKKEASDRAKRMYVKIMDNLAQSNWKETKKFMFSAKTLQTAKAEFLPLPKGFPQSSEANAYLIPRSPKQVLKALQ